MLNLNILLFVYLLFSRVDEHFMFVFVPVSLRMLPDELWPRAMTSLFYTYVVIFYMLSSVSTALTV